MQSKAATVEEYVASLPEDRRAAVEAIRKVIRRNLDRDCAEVMQYGMIGYVVPHSVYPAGYHCDPRQPLPMAGLASQKQHLSLYLMGLYVGGDSPYARWFAEAWKKTGKKLDMGKACIRFKKLEDVPLEVIGEAFKRLPAKTYIEAYEKNLNASRSGKAAAAKSAGKKAAKKAPKKVSKKKTAGKK
ncbi:MAG: DUF1801 domain-containing protein [Phycisphaerales bacterium]|nr:DUF1801 domain-containing protein [Phycisphaerales bacterium]